MIALHVDDILLFLAEPEKSVAALINIIDIFSSFSIYKINFDKFEALPLGAFGNNNNNNLISHLGGLKG